VEKAVEFAERIKRVQEEVGTVLRKVQSIGENEETSK